MNVHSKTSGEQYISKKSKKPTIFKGSKRKDMIKKIINKIKNIIFIKA